MLTLIHIQRNTETNEEYLIPVKLNILINLSAKHSSLSPFSPLSLSLSISISMYLPIYLHLMCESGCSSVSFFSRQIIHSLCIVHIIFIISLVFKTSVFVTISIFLGKNIVQKSFGRYRSVRKNISN